MLRVLSASLHSRPSGCQPMVVSSSQAGSFPPLCSLFNPSFPFSAVMGCDQSPAHLGVPRCPQPLPPPHVAAVAAAAVPGGGSSVLLCQGPGGSQSSAGCSSEHIPGLMAGGSCGSAGGVSVGGEGLLLGDTSSCFSQCCLSWGWCWCVLGMVLSSVGTMLENKFAGI